MSVMEQPQQQEQEVVRGVVQSVITKGPDKWQVAVMPEGSQYTRNLWTKEQALVNDMSMRIGQAFDFLCNASHWTNQSGQPVRSLWIQTVGAYMTMQQPMQAAPQQQQAPQTTYQPPPGPGVMQGGVGSPQSATGYTPPPGQPQPQQQRPPNLVPQRLPDEVREMRIMRMGAMKVAAALLPFLPEPERNLSGLQKVAEWQVRYYTGGPQGDPWQQPVPQADGQNPTYNPNQGGDPYAGDPGPQENQYESYGGGFPQ